MQSFRYKAMDENGNLQYGNTDAINTADLEIYLRRMKLDLINHKVISKQWIKSSIGGVQRRDLSLFCFHMEQTLRAGVPIIESLEDLRDSADNKKFLEVISSMLELIEGGKTLSESMSMFPKVFDEVMVNLVHAGEQSGQLSEIFSKLDADLKWQDEQIEHTKKLLRYPAFVGVVVLSMVFFLLIYLVPELLNFVKTMGQEIPIQTQMLLLVSDLFVNYWWIILTLPSIFLIVIWLLMKISPLVRYKVDSIKLQIPIIGAVLKKIMLARLTSTFAIMYESGITITDTLLSLEKTAGNAAMNKAIVDIRQRIIDGTSLTESFRAAKIFPPLVLRMLYVGERTGALYDALVNISYFYNRDVKNSIDKLQSLIEPSMIFILATIIGWIILSILGPIYDLISQIDF